MTQLFVDEYYIEITKQWINEFIIQFGLCPFAATPYFQNKILYQVEQSTNEKQIIDSIVNTISLLQEKKVKTYDTGFLIIPNCFQEFDTFNQFANVCDAVLAEMNLVGDIQIVQFHPNFCYFGNQQDDIQNYTNRSIFPTIHLLRETDITEALKNGINTGDIIQRNMARLNTLNEKTILNMQANIVRKVKSEFN